MLTCPRDQTALQTQKQHDIEIDACGTCHGAWYDFDELTMLEASAARDDNALAGMIEYSKRTGELKCPKCGELMVAFDYRGNNLELDACPQEHGFWLDTGEAERVRQIMQERSRGLSRSASAEKSWQRAREGGSRGNLTDRVRDLFRRR